MFPHVFPKFPVAGDEVNFPAVSDLLELSLQAIYGAENPTNHTVRAPIGAPNEQNFPCLVPGDAQIRRLALLMKSEIDEEFWEMPDSALFSTES